MSSKILETIEKIFSLSNDIDNFQEGKIDDEKREKAFQIKKLNENINKLLDNVRRYKKWKNIYTSINMSLAKTEVLENITKEIKDIHISELNNDDLKKLIEKLNSLKETVENGIIQVKDLIKEKLTKIGEKIAKSLNLIKQFSNIPEINDKINIKYQEYFESPFSDNEMGHIVNYLKNLNINNIIKLGTNKLEEFLKMNQFSSSIYEILDFKGIQEMFGFNTKTINNLKKIIKQKGDIPLIELELDALAKIKEKFPQFYLQLNLKYK